MCAWTLKTLAGCVHAQAHLSLYCWHMTVIGTKTSWSSPFICSHAKLDLLSVLLYIFTSASVFYNIAEWQWVTVNIVMSTINWRRECHDLDEISKLFRIWYLLNGQSRNAHTSLQWSTHTGYMNMHVWRTAFHISLKAICTQNSISRPKGFVLGFFLHWITGWSCDKTKLNVIYLWILF